MQERKRILNLFYLIAGVTLGQSSFLPRNFFETGVDAPACNCVSTKFTSLLAYRTRQGGASGGGQGRGLLFGDFVEQKFVFINLGTRERHVIDVKEDTHHVVLKQQPYCMEENLSLFPFPLPRHCVQGELAGLRYLGVGGRTKANHVTELWSRVTASLNCTESYVIIEDQCFPHSVSCYNMNTAALDLEVEYAAQHEGIRYSELFQYPECSVDSNQQTSYRRQSSVVVNRRNEKSKEIHVPDELEKAIKSWQKNWYMLQ